MTEARQILGREGERIVARELQSRGWQIVARNAERFQASSERAAKDAALRDAMAKSGLSIVGGSAAEFRRFIDADVARWGPVITRLGVKLY